MMTMPFTNMPVRLWLAASVVIDLPLIIEWAVTR